MDRTDLSFLEPMFGCEVQDIGFSIVVVNQSINPTLNSNFDCIKVINDSTYGLSRSRNIAIENSNKSLLWILDDDCTVLPTAIKKIITAHNNYKEPVLTFRTRRKEDENHFWNYPEKTQILDSTLVRKVLSPEITLKKKEFLRSKVQYNPLFGLGGKFQDSENYVFLTDLMDVNQKIRFVPEDVVTHESLTSSDEAFSDRVIYARGALAARKGYLKSIFLNFKYSFFLWRKGYLKSIKDLGYKHTVFKQGVADYKAIIKGEQ